MFFFKQKTAYDMRISDWSSDVFSSDLVDLGLGIGAGYDRAKAHGIGTRNVEHEEARRALRHGRPDFGGDARLDRRERDEQGEAKTERDDERAGRGTGTMQVRERETEERAFWPWQATRGAAHQPAEPDEDQQEDRKSTRLNSSH